MSKNPLTAKAAVPYARALYDFSVEQNLMHHYSRFSKLRSLFR